MVPLCEKIIMHPLLTDFALDYDRLGPSEPFARTAMGQAIIDTLTSHDPVCALLAVIDAAPSRPPQPALDRYLIPVLGARAADDACKILEGRIIRQIAEHLGARFIRSDVTIIVPSACTSGSIYQWPGRQLGRMNATGRREWTELMANKIGSDQHLSV